MKSRTTLALAALGLLATSAAQAVAISTPLTEWGTLATISSYDCVNDLCDPFSGAQTFAETLAVGPSDGAIGQNSAAVAVGTTWPAPGSASGTATVASGLAVPVLKAAAAATSNSWLAGQALAIQAYTYGGAGETLSLNWNLTGSVNNPDNDGVTGLVVFAGFFKDSLLAFPNVAQPSTVFALLKSLETLSPVDEFHKFTANGAVTEGGTIDLTVTTGEEFYLVMGLMAGAGGSNANAQSLSTLVGAFQGTPDLTPALTAVPIPPAAWLLGSALAGLITRRRRI
jgi:hypothetical protein